MIRKRPSPNKGKVIVTFEIPGMIWAERINLVGDFNDWDPQSLPFRQNRQGVWQVELELEAGRKYSFRYLLDGQHWRDGYEPNPYGGYNSIVVARVPPERRR
jgi:hypothetical protein